MIKIRSLHDARTGLPAAVLGGGPSLHNDLLHFVPRDAVLISANQHALRYCQPNYLVCLDKLVPSPEFASAFCAPAHLAMLRISPIRDQSDVNLCGVDWWHAGYSGQFATWLACWIGCDPVLLCGMDCYQGKRSEDADPNDNAYNWPLSEHLDGWRKAFSGCEHPERIKAVSGPLIDLFGKWSPE
jgi:hypothetical protein